MANLTSRKSGGQKKTTQTSILNRTLSRSKAKVTIPFVQEEVIPPGNYRTEIVDVLEDKTRSGKDAVAVVYCFIDEADHEVKAKELYPIDGYYLGQLCDHLIDEGLLHEESTLAQLVGIKESVEVVYPYRGSLGRLQNRQPIKGVGSKSSTVKKLGSVVKVEQDVSEDDEFDDFLEDD